MTTEFKVGDKVKYYKDTGLLTSHWKKHWEETEGPCAEDGTFIVIKTANEYGEIKYSNKIDGNGPRFTKCSMVKVDEFTLEEGKFYKNGYGKKRGPIAPYTFLYRNVPWTDGHFTYHENGVWAGAGDDNLNLVSEWVDEETKVTPKFKVGDRITWGGKSASYIVQRIEKDKVYFVPGSGEFIDDPGGTEIPNAKEAYMDFVESTVEVLDKESKITPESNVGDYVVIVDECNQGVEPIYVGDKVKYYKDDGWLEEHWNNYWRYDEGECSKDGTFYVTQILGSSVVYSNKPNGKGPMIGISEVIKVSHTSSPVAEKTIKYIKNGLYVKFNVEDTMRDTVNIGITDGFTTCSNEFNAQELEEAANVFLELAKFLRENR